MRATFAALAVLLCASCELVVGDSVPTNIACEGELASSCPSDFQCVGGICVKCVAPGCETLLLDAGRDAGHDSSLPTFDAGRDVTAPPDVGHGEASDVTMVVVDAGHDVATTSGALGATCVPSEDQCATGLFCLDTVNLPGLSLGAGNVCSATCCEDSDCSGGVCYPTVGGNYCVTQAFAQACGGTCGTACCSNSACGGDGLYCAPGTASGSAAQGTSVPSCRMPDPSEMCMEDDACTGGTSAEDDCYTDADCDEGVCIDENGESCDPDGEDVCGCFDASPCCAQSDCTGDDTSCQWLATSTRTFHACNERTSGAKSTGDTCSGNSTEGNAECDGDVCAPLGMATVCTQPCCQDTDCTGIASPQWVCRPANLTLGNGAQELLVCQPPSSTVN